MEFLETGKVIKPSAAKEKGKTKKANEKFYQWFLVQYQDFQQTLCNLISSDQEWSHALSIRTMMEVRNTLFPPFHLSVFILILYVVAN